MNKVNIFRTLLKREILEHKNIWRVPVILLVIAVLVRISLSVGNLAVDINLPSQLQLNEAVDSVVSGVVVKSLSSLNFIIMLVMFIVAVFYALSCLFNERQDDSVLFWRSLPLSDSMTVASKLAIALVVIPLMILVCQTMVVILFMGTNSVSYLLSYYSQFVPFIVKVLLWSLLPVISWCLFCSEVAKKNPFLLAFIVPILVIVVDKLFLGGWLSQTFIINRVTGVSHYSVIPLLFGIVFSAICIGLAVLKRSQRI